DLTDSRVLPERLSWAPLPPHTAGAHVDATCNAEVPFLGSGARGPWSHPTRLAQQALRAPEAVADEQRPRAPPDNRSAIPGHIAVGPHAVSSPARPRQKILAARVHYAPGEPESLRPPEASTHGRSPPADTVPQCRWPGTDAHGTSGSTPPQHAAMPYPG